MKRLLLKLVLMLPMLMLVGCAMGPVLPESVLPKEDVILSKKNIQNEDAQAIENNKYMNGAKAIGTKFLVVDEKNGKIINLETKREFNLVSASGKVPSLVGIVGALNDKIFYTHFEFGQRIFEAYDTKTKQPYVILNDTNHSKYIQMFEYNYNYVLKIFTDPKVSYEAKGGKHKSLDSEYDNLSARYIHLNTLKEYKGISNDFNRMVFISSYENMGGGYTYSTYVTLLLDTFHDVSRKNVELFYINKK